MASSLSYQVCVVRPAGEIRPKITSASACPPISPGYHKSTIASQSRMSVAGAKLPPCTRTQTRGDPVRFALSSAANESCPEGREIVVRSAPSFSWVLATLPPWPLLSSLFFELCVKPRTRTVTSAAFAALYADMRCTTSVAGHELSLQAGSHTSDEVVLFDGDGTGGQAGHGFDGLSHCPAVATFLQNVRPA
jgi:hypothetical protein